MAENQKPESFFKKMWSPADGVRWWQVRKAREAARQRRVKAKEADGSAKDNGDVR